MHRTHTARSALAALAVLATVCAGAAPALAAPKPGHGTPVTVMTRNLYLGGDIGRPLNAVAALPAGASDEQKLVTFANANFALRSIVDRTDFPARSRLLAREIAGTEPDLVGLQEVALWRHGPLDLAQVGLPDATTVDYDFLATLIADLAALGEPYQAVAVEPESDVEGPAFHTVGANPFADARDVRLTMRDVILRRTGSAVAVERSGGGHYAANLVVQLGGATFAFTRGYAWVDVRLGAKSLRLVNTHLESQFSGLALAQAAELMNGAADVTGRPVVVVCDCNSDPLDASTKPGDPTPHKAPYELVVAHGFQDEWLRFATAQQGFTSGLSELVDDADLSGIDHRIDMVFGRTADGSPMPADHGRIVGGTARTPTGLWASDHLGVVLRVRP